MRQLVFILACLLGVGGCLPSTAEPTAEILVWGRHGLEAGRVVKPRAITIDASDQLYIADKTGRIQVADRGGNVLRWWRTPLSIQGKPCGLSVSNDGLLMVADTHYFRVLFYQSDGTLVENRTIGGTNGRGPGEFGFVTDVVQDSHSNYYVAEYGDFDRIQKFDPKGNFVCQWGEHGTEPGNFLRPQGLAMDQHDHLWVADVSNHRIQVFDVAGQVPKLVRWWGEQGSEVGKLSYPYSIDLSGADLVLVCEMGNHRVQAFTRAGKSLGVFGGPGREPGQFHQPWAICQDSLGSFHIVDTYNHRMQRFEMDSILSQDNMEDAVSIPEN